MDDRCGLIHQQKRPGDQNPRVSTMAFVGNDEPLVTRHDLRQAGAAESPESIARPANNTTTPADRHRSAEQRSGLARSHRNSTRRRESWHRNRSPGYTGSACTYTVHIPDGTLRRSHIPARHNRKLVPSNHRPGLNSQHSSAHKTPGDCTTGCSTTASCTSVDSRTASHTSGHNNPHNHKTARSNSRAVHGSRPSPVRSNHCTRASTTSLNRHRPDPDDRSSIRPRRPRRNPNAASCFSPHGPIPVRCVPDPAHSASVLPLDQSSLMCVAPVTSGFPVMIFRTLE